MTDDEICRTLARRLNAKIGPHGELRAVVSTGKIGKWTTQSIGKIYRDPMRSHDTIHAIEETLGGEEAIAYMDKLSGPPEMMPVPIGDHPWRWILRHAPARVLAEALAEVIGGKG